MYLLIFVNKSYVSVNFGPTTDDPNIPLNASQQVSLKMPLLIFYVSDHCHAERSIVLAAFIFDYLFCTYVDP